MGGLAKLNKSLSKKLDNKTEHCKFFETRGESTVNIPLGNYLLNAQVSGSLFGGLPDAKSIMLAGASGTGKSFLCLNMVKGMADLGYHIYYVDTEGALDNKTFENFGLTASQEEDENVNVTYIRDIKTYSKLKFFINTLTSTIKELKAEEGFNEKVALVVDSVGMLNTDSEVENAEKGRDPEDMGKRAKAIRALFRTITLDLSNLCIPFVYTNHTSANLDLFAIEKEVTAGGGGAVYAPSYILMLAVRNFIKDEQTKEKKGVIIRSRPKKNRTAVPHEIEFNLSWTHGMNPYVGLQEYLTWDICHVAFGNLYTKEEFEKKFKKGTDGLRTESWKDKKGEWVAVLNPNMRSKKWVVKSSDEEVPFAETFTSKVFTNEVLHEMDENVIKPLFEYSNGVETADEIMDMLDGATEEVATE